MGFGLFPSSFFNSVPQPYGPRPGIGGFSHGLKSVHRTLFTPVCALVPAFRIPVPTINKGAAIAAPLFMVGVSGFEPEASWTRTKRDTKLRHTPIAKLL